MFCEQCGSKIQDGLPFCDKCGASIDFADFSADVPAYSEPRQPQTRQEVQARKRAREDSVVTSQQTTKTRPQPERQARPRPERERMAGIDVKYRSAYEGNPLGGLKLSENEEIIKQYHCATIGSAEGYLSVTNKRMIFHSESGKGMFYNRVAKELSLNNISGIESYYGTNISWLRAVLGILLILVAFNTGDLGIAKNILGKAGVVILSVILIAIGALIIKGSIEKNFTFKVYASDCNPSPISLGLGAITALGGGLLNMGGVGNRSMMTFMGWNAEDTDAMMDELGALVHDIQTMGDLAVKKWKR